MKIVKSTTQSRQWSEAWTAFGDTFIRQAERQALNVTNQNPHSPYLPHARAAVQTDPIKEQYFATIPLDHNIVGSSSNLLHSLHSFTTASLHSSKDALDILKTICTPASVLFDPKFTSRQRPSPSPPFRTFPPSPALARAFFSVPSTISIRNLDNTEPPVEMDKRHPSSFQQLEKLGEGTYATVSSKTPLFEGQRGFVPHIIQPYCSRSDTSQNSMLTLSGLQRSKSTDRRIRGA